MIIKKSEDGYKKIAEEISKVLEHNKNLEEGQTPTDRTVLKITKGLLFTGSISIRDNVCRFLKIKPWDAPFTIDIDWDKENNSDFKLIITYK